MIQLVNLKILFRTKKKSISSLLFTRRAKEIVAKTEQLTGRRFSDKIISNLINFIKRYKKKGKDSLVGLMIQVMHRLNYQDLIKIADLYTIIGTYAARFYTIRRDTMNEGLTRDPAPVAFMKRDLSVAECPLKDKDKDTGHLNGNRRYNGQCTISDSHGLINDYTRFLNVIPAF